MHYRMWVLDQTHFILQYITDMWQELGQWHKQLCEVENITCELCTWLNFKEILFNVSLFEDLQLTTLCGIIQHNNCFYN